MAKKDGLVLQFAKFATQKGQGEVGKTKESKMHGY
jgi:hypothetical protein